MSSKKNIPSPGGVLPNKALYEQIEVNGSMQYAVKEGEKISIKPMLSVGEHILYQPLDMPPWHLPGPPVDYGSIEDLWSGIRQFIYAHLDVEIDSLYDILTGWVLVTWVTERFDSVGYLHFHGPRNSGKTRGLDILNYLCFRSLESPSASGASLFRALDAYHPTFLLDEFELYEKQMESKAEIIGIMNAGYRRGQVVLRIAGMKEGNPILKGFKVFGPKAISSIEDLPDALRSRCIRFPMTKAYRKISVLIDKETAAELRSKLLYYRFKHLYDPIPEGNPVDLPDGRLIEMYYPLEHVAPTEEIKKGILDYARSQYNASVEEDRATLEAKVFSTIIDMLQTEIRLTIPQANLREVMNAPITNPKEKMGNKRLGTVLARLNLKSVTNKKRRKEVVIDPDVLERRKQRYFLVSELERVDKIIGAVRTLWMDMKRGHNTSISSIYTYFSNYGGGSSIDADKGASTHSDTQLPIKDDIIGDIPVIGEIGAIDEIGVEPLKGIAKNCNNCGDPLNNETGQFTDPKTGHWYCRQCFSAMRGQGLIK